MNDVWATLSSYPLSKQRNRLRMSSVPLDIIKVTHQFIITSFKEVLGNDNLAVIDSNRNHFLSEFSKNANNENRSENVDESAEDSDISLHSPRQIRHYRQRRKLQRMPSQHTSDVILHQDILSWEIPFGPMTALAPGAAISSPSIRTKLYDCKLVTFAGTYFNLELFLSRYHRYYEFSLSPAGRIQKDITVGCQVDIVDPVNQYKSTFRTDFVTKTFHSSYSEDHKIRLPNFLLIDHLPFHLSEQKLFLTIQVSLFKDQR